jgi:hypothetical protein
LAFVTEPDYKINIRDIPEFTVKVQLALATSDGAAGKRCLLTNEEGTLYDETEDQEVIRLMAGRPRAYFRAKLENTFLTLGEEVPEEDW